MSSVFTISALISPLQYFWEPQLVLNWANIHLHLGKLSCMAVALQTRQGRGGEVEAATTPHPPFYYDLSVLVIIIACKCQQDAATARARISHCLSEDGCAWNLSYRQRRADHCGCKMLWQQSIMLVARRGLMMRNQDQRISLSNGTVMTIYASEAETFCYHCKRVIR